MTSVKRLWTVAVFLLAGFGAVAQTPEADALRRLAAGPLPDTARLRVFLETGWELTDDYPADAAVEFKKALQLAERLGVDSSRVYALNGLGATEAVQNNYAAARQYYQEALTYSRQKNYLRGQASAINNLANLYELQDSADVALRFRKQALLLAEELRDTARIARAQFNLAASLQELGLYPEAMGVLNEARLLMEMRQDPEGKAAAYTLMGHIQFELDQYKTAREWYKEALKIREKQSNDDALAAALNDYANALDELDSSAVALSYYRRALELRQQLNDRAGLVTVYNNLGDAHKHLGNYVLAEQYLNDAIRIGLENELEQSLMESYNILGDVLFRKGKVKEAIQYVERYSAIARRLGDKKYIQRSFKDYARNYAALGEYKTAYDYRVKYDEYREKLLNDQIALDFARKDALFADERKQLQIERQDRLLERQQADLKLRDEKLRRARLGGYALVGGALALALLVGLLYNRNRIRARANRELAAKNAAIEQERARADALLKNILPEITARELIANNSVQTIGYQQVTVMFTDFKDFTKVAEKLSPEELVAELDQCFRLFDSIVSEYNLEKIKTIGDAYMCAGGLPATNTTHPVDAVGAALAMQEALARLNAQRKPEQGPGFEMRIGIHTGPVVAGVVGSHKFAYDIWGDTVNIAARMEQTGEPGRINISENTYIKVKERFKCIYRGNLAAKNKAPLAMYFVEEEAFSNT